MTGLRIVPAGDSAVLIELPARIDPHVNARAVALAEVLATRCAATLRDVVVGFCSVTLYFDPLLGDVESIREEVIAADDALPGHVPIQGRVLDVPVCYGGTDGPDLAEVAARAHASEDEVIAMHAGRTYRVYLLGFLPGFAYMASVDPRIALPRRAAPRERVPAGSVAIAAGQTGIYPTESPGGWHLIGRTSLVPYDPDRTEPFLFRAGDQVRFHAVDRAALRLDG